MKSIFTLKIFLWTLLGLAVAGIGGFYFFAIKNQSEYEFLTVEKRDLVQEVTITGTVKSVSAVNLEFLTSGKIISVPVKIGNRVTAGQLLIALDARDVNIQLNKAQAALEGARAKLTQLQAGATLQTITELENALTNTKAKADADLSKQYSLALNYIDNALTKADKIMASIESDVFSNKNTIRGDFVLSSAQIANDTQTKKIAANTAFPQIRTLRYEAVNAIDQTMIDVVLSQIIPQLEKIRSLAISVTDLINSISPTQTITQTSINTYLTNITTNRADFDSAIASLRQIIQDIANQKAVNQKAVQDVADALAVKKEPPRQIDIDVLAAEVKAKEADVAAFVKHRSDTGLFAPTESIVTNIPYEIGEIARMNTTAISLISPHALEIEANVPEIDISKISVGNKVNVTIDAFQNETWTGAITHIDPAETIVDGVANFKIKVTFDKDDPRLKTGLTANLNIQTLKKDGAVAIPQYGLSEKDAGTYVKILEKEGVIEKKVQIGIKSSDGYVEILSGLTVGDRIVNAGLKTK